MARETDAARVDIREQVGNLLMLRSSVAPLFEKISRLDSARVVVDFSGVEFMSRSFADEYRAAKAKATKRVEETHVPEAVQRMFHLVATQVASAHSGALEPGPSTHLSKVVTL